ncbi:MAG: alkaline phosphatase family protein [Acidobacteria bacterium]|nr:alkaline phosphatase family protein [Acidobacteriota bacterium]
MRKIIITLILCLSAPFTVFSQKPIKDLKPTVILISLDGFRYDYLDKYKPKVLNQLAKKGVRAKWMIPSFPSKTFPNHYTIATGLYPEHHGIIENNIYYFDSVFAMNKIEEVQNPRWWLGEPIWVTAIKQGQKSASFFFPGTETPIQGTLPTFWKHYDGKIPNTERIDTILGWLDLPQKERPTVYTLYFSDTDDGGHQGGPDSIEIQNAVRKVDGDIERLVSGLKARKIYKKVNVIIVADHGMANVNLDNAVFLDDYINLADTERILWTNEIIQIFPKDGKEDELANQLKKANHATCWKKSEIPERLHFNDSPRIAPIICSTEEGWVTTSHDRYNAVKKKNDHGGHGYDNALVSMRATFIAHGAAFKKGFVAEPFQNIQVYNLMCAILGLQPAKNDGDFSVVSQMLKKPKLLPPNPSVRTK